MNKRAIWIIIVLMSAALIGITVLQVSLLSSAAQLKRDQFVRDVFAAMNDVAAQLEKDEETRNYNGYSIRYYQKEREQQKLSLLPQLENIEILNRQFKLQEDGFLGIQLTESERIKFAIMSQYNEPLERRFSLQALTNYIYRELKNRNINTKCNFGVFSNEKNGFIIENGHYLVEDNSPKDFLPGYKNLYNSDYVVSLFQQAGKLFLHFPNEEEYLRSKIWLNILGSVLFTVLIMFCFAYAVNVVFQQKKLSEMKNDFINNMTHEFKTPIATISLAADSITSPIISGNASKVQRFANIIKQENKRMNSQVEKVLQMALLDKKDFSLKIEKINLNNIINRAIENIGLQVEKKEGTAFAELQATNPIVEGDPTHVSNVINNLLDNANKYSPEKPEISVHTRNVANGVEVTVKDKGVGMSSEARKHIFDKFYRVHTGDLHDVKGFGLGLSYVKAMMTAHKGTIDVKSELGKGSSFILFFPFNVQN